MAERDIVGGLFFLGGALVTVFFLGLAGNDGSQFLAWGAILFGGFQLARGLNARRNLRSEPGQGNDALADGDDQAPEPEFAARAEPTPDDPTIPQWILWAVGVVVVVLVLIVMYQIDTGELPW